ncbi:flagellar protein FlgN [Sporosarcina pasteurii]|uniref:FlgN protein n=1 Tax=Sporosarcina pasteurii TaxID=1474 RepID=A0A380BER9_SPOPA|nr:flagellar protein FlgN [Sporosarcina pasteurii]MDS9470324.1 flagellar protein FlgN [Sporosarcina pasteurii]QBQ05963.1 flagellar protein FlgN [Sporosarcina pasteurii]SUI99811.1 FlgN protein [Sporosarcina pasteurii]
MSIQPILAALTNLEKMHSSLLSLAHDKTAVIKEGDMAALNQLLKDEQAHLAAIAQIEQQRQLAVADYLKKQGRFVSENPTISDVLSAVQSTSEKESLTEAKNRLLHVIHDLKWQNDLNQKLTYQSLQFVNLSLDMVRPQQEAVTYSKNEISGKLEMRTRPTFDSQA